MLLSLTLFTLIALTVLFLSIERLLYTRPNSSSTIDNIRGEQEKNSIRMDALKRRISLFWGYHDAEGGRETDEDDKRKALLNINNEELSQLRNVSSKICLNRKRRLKWHKVFFLCDLLLTLLSSIALVWIIILSIQYILN